MKLQTTRTSVASRPNFEANCLPVVETACVECRAISFGPSSPSFQEQ